MDFGWTLYSPHPDLPYDWYSVRWTGRLVAPASGLYRIGVEGNDGWRLWIDGRVLIDNWRKQSYRTLLADVDFEPGRTVEVRLEYYESTGNARLRLVWDAGIAADWQAKIDSAVPAQPSIAPGLAALRAGHHHHARFQEGVERCPQWRDQQQDAQQRELIPHKQTAPPGPARPVLSMDLVSRYVVPHLGARPVVFFVIDCMRYDQWLEFERLLYPFFNIETEFYYSILPTATP